MFGDKYFICSDDYRSNEMYSRDLQFSRISTSNILIIIMKNAHPRNVISTQHLLFVPIVWSQAKLDILWRLSFLMAKMKN